MPDAAHTTHERSRAETRLPRVLSLCLVLGLGLFLGAVSPALAEISETPASTRQATRGVKTPVIRPNEYNAMMNESRAQEQKLTRNLPRNEHVTPRFQHPSKNVRPQNSADRSPLTRR